MSSVLLSVATVCGFPNWPKTFRVLVVANVGKKFIWTTSDHLEYDDIIASVDRSCESSMRPIKWSDRLWLCSSQLLRFWCSLLLRCSLSASMWSSADKLLLLPEYLEGCNSARVDGESHVILSGLGRLLENAVCRSLGSWWLPRRQEGCCSYPLTPHCSQHRRRHSYCLLDVVAVMRWDGIKRPLVRNLLC